MLESLKAYDDNNSISQAGPIYFSGHWLALAFKGPIEKADARLYWTDYIVAERKAESYDLLPDRTR